MSLGVNNCLAHDIGPSTQSTCFNIYCEILTADKVDIICD